MRTAMMLLTVTLRTAHARLHVSIKRALVDHLDYPSEHDGLPF